MSSEHSGMSSTDSAGVHVSPRPAGEPTLLSRAAAVPGSPLDGHMSRRLGYRIAARVCTWRPETADGALYAASGLFAVLTIAFSTIALYRQWAELAIGPYAAAAAVSFVMARFSPKPALRKARASVLLLVLVGATLVPLGLEVEWHAVSRSSSYVQPEVSVVQQAAYRASKGKDPYQTVVGPHHRILLTTPGEPTYENFFPYLPLMLVFGLPSTTKEPLQISDARIFFSLVTLLVAAGALAMTRASKESKMRTFQVLTVLPTAALPLATGGDDMPIVALLLLGMVLAQRRRPGWSGLVLGIVCAMKLTAWPLAVLALLAARTRDNRRAILPMVTGMLVIGGAVIVPFVLRGPHAFFENLVLFPLGLSGVPTPAASPLPGHLLVSAFPSLGRVLPISAALAGGAVLARYLWRRRPTTAAEVSTLAGWVMLVAILVAPGVRFGYALYPINFFVWGWMLRAPGGAKTSARRILPSPDGRVADQAPSEGMTAREPVLA